MKVMIRKNSNLCDRISCIKLPKRFCAFVFACGIVYKKINFRPRARHGMKIILYSSLQDSTKGTKADQSEV